MNKFSLSTSVSLLVAICLVSFGFMLYASLTDSGTMDELAHIPSGYSYVRYLDYRLNPEHPPIIKALAGIPLLLLNLNFPTNQKAWTTDINGQWEAGTEFLYHSGNNADTIILWARFGPMLLTLLLIILTYLWSRELLGRIWALLPALLVGLSPSVLAHGHYVTTDIGAAFGILFATYFFIKHLFSPSRKNLIYASLAFGVAQALKFSAVLLIPYFFFLVLVFFLADAVRNWKHIANHVRYFGLKALHLAGRTLGIVALGYILVVYPLYFLFTINYPIEKQMNDTTFILGSFAGGPAPAGTMCKPTRCLADMNIWMSKHSLTRPIAQYELGVLMVMQRSAGGNTGYFMGEVSAAGWRSYFPVVYALKEPIPVLLMVLIALAVSIGNITRKLAQHGRRAGSVFLDYLQTNFTEFAMIVFVIFYWAYSMKSPLNIGFRHLFPTIPLIYILTASGLKRWITRIEKPANMSLMKMVAVRLKAIASSIVKYAILTVLVAWFAFETFAAAPYFLSYFNEFGGGVSGGYRYATDSNYDWGQDLLRLKEWAAQHPEADRIAVDYFGAGNPKYYLGDASNTLGTGKAENWWSARGNPADIGIHYLAVSVNTLQGAMGKLVNGQLRNPEDEYRWLQDIYATPTEWGSVPTPYARVGTSLFIYKL